MIVGVHLKEFCSCEVKLWLFLIMSSELEFDGHVLNLSIDDSLLFNWYFNIYYKKRFNKKKKPDKLLTSLLEGLLEGLDEGLYVKYLRSEFFILKLF